MKIELDQVQPSSGAGYVAYLKLTDNTGKVIATKSVLFDGNIEAFKMLAKTKFQAIVTEELLKEKTRVKVENAIRTAISTIILEDEI